MKKMIWVVITGLMLVGTFSAAAAPKQDTLGPVIGQGNAPMPMCSPSDPRCQEER